MWGNQGGDAGNQEKNLSKAVVMTQNSNGNNKFNEWGEVKIIENEHIYENVVSYIWSGALLLTFDIFLTVSFCFYYWFWTGKSSKMKILCHFHINSFSSSF